VLIESLFKDYGVVASEKEMADLAYAFSHLIIVFLCFVIVS